MIDFDSLPVLERGLQDERIVIQLIDADGTPMEYDSVIDLKVFVLVNAIEVAKFSKEEAEGFGTISDVEGEPTQAKFLIDREDTSSWNTGLMTLKIQYVVEHDDFPEGKATTKITDPIKRVI